MLLLLLLIPFMLWGYIWLYKRRGRTAPDLGPLSLVQNTSGKSLGIQRHIAPIFYLIGLTLLLFGLSRPEFFIELPHVEGTIILAFDVSQSMAADDLEPTRMEAAKAAAKTLIENQPNTIDVGVVAFSNGGLVLQPPTNNQALLLTTIERLNPQGATSLAQGIFNSLNAIAGEAIALDQDLLEEGAPTPDIGHYPSSVVLLLTDGENTSSSDPIEIAQIAANAGVRIYPVGIGSKEGTILEIDGYNILTQLNETALQTIASMTNGTYYHAEDEEALQEIYNNVDLQLTISGEKMEATAIITAFSLIFFLIGGILSLFWFGRMPL